MLRHIAALHKLYPQWRELEIFVIPENNTRHAATSLSLHLMDINLQYAYFNGRIPNITVLRCLKRDDTTYEELPGITTTNANKTSSIARLDARLRKGQTAISIAPQFVTTTPDLTSQLEPTLDPNPLALLDNMRKQFIAMQTIPPSLEREKKVVTFSGKIIGEQDDFVMTIAVCENGNTEIERQKLIRALARGAVPPAGGPQAR